MQACLPIIQPDATAACPVTRVPRNNVTTKRNAHFRPSHPPKFQCRDFLVPISEISNIAAQCGKLGFQPFVQLFASSEYSLPLGWPRHFRPSHPPTFRLLSHWRNVTISPSKAASMELLFHILCNSLHDDDDDVVNALAFRKTVVPKRVFNIQLPSLFSLHSNIRPRSIPQIERVPKHTTLIP